MISLRTALALLTALIAAAGATAAIVWAVQRSHDGVPERLRSCGEDRGAHAVKTSEGLVDTVAALLGDELQGTFSSQVGYLLSRRAYRRFQRRHYYPNRRCHGVEPVYQPSGRHQRRHPAYSDHDSRDYCGRARQCAERRRPAALTTSYVLMVVQRKNPLPC